ncbi:MAG: c-type cytochrome [Bryobacteraceae bacterium]|nr:c-type cytochrome [Bryobacteraceae bacterium]
MPRYWCLFALATLAGGCGRGPASQKALTAQESVKAMRVSEDFRIEVFAAEPDITDPVEMAFDENGRVYVAEMRDYPDDPPAGKPVRSRIRLLEDADGDGKFEKNTIFADQVLAVSGLMPWKGGLLVTSAPDIFYMRDGDGDGKADVREVLYTGFPKVNHEARITNLRLSIDNWIYAANEGRDGTITSPKFPKLPPILVRGADFRFHPVRGNFEPASGPTQFGMSFDHWGNRFLTQNTIHLRHAVVPMKYLARAPFLQVGAVSQNLYENAGPSVPVYPLTKPQAWREQRTKLRQQRYDENKLNRVEHVFGFITAASGGTVYTGDAFPPSYIGSVFTGDVNGNLIRRDELKPSGVTFRAKAAKEGVEFLASTDVWFRPCNFANAPDGNLYFMDIYREFIETPESIPDEIKKSMDFYAGDTMGRIYRIVANNPRVKRDLRPKLGAMSSAELVKLFEHENGWHRQTAQRLLLERQDKTVAGQLKEMAAKSQAPLARAHALWMLEGLGALEASDVKRALKDPHEGVREHAIRLAEGFLAQLGGDVLAMAGDSEPRVLFQLALTAGYIQHPRTLETLASIAARNVQDRWFRIAVLSSVSDRPLEMLRLLLTRGGEALAPELMSLIGSRRNPAELAQALLLVEKIPGPESALDGMARGMRLAAAGRIQSPAAEAPLARLLESPSEAVRNSAWEVARYFELRQLVARAVKDVESPATPMPSRVRAVRALRGGDFAQVSPIVKKILESTPPAELQTAALEAISAFDDAGVSDVILKNWRSYSPDARTKAVAAMLSSQKRIPALLDAVEQGRIEANAIDIAARARLMEQVGERAKKLFQAQASDRMKVVEQYKESVTLTGNVERGRKLFDDSCAKCHMPRKQGGRVGPDLSGINNKTKEELVMSILNPSYAIEPRYTNYIVTTKDGRVHDGVIAAETPTVLTLRGGTEEADDIILRSNITEIRASTISLMPEDLESSIDKQGMADVIAYLRGTK